MKLNLFELVKGVSESDLHPKFKLLRDLSQLDGERKIIESWTDGFEDRDNKIIKEFQTTFHSSFWEFYLFNLFTEMGLTIDFTKNRPDFIITNPYKIYTEAVVSNIKSTGRNEGSRNAQDILTMLDPPHLQKDFYPLVDEAITRYSNAIHSKHQKYCEDYSKEKWIRNDIPYIIALASYDQVNYGREFYYPLMALLYGQYYNPIKDLYEFKETIFKPGSSSKIPLGLFNNDTMKSISGILFSCTVTIGKLTSLSISINNSDLGMNHVLNIRHDSEFPYYRIQDVSQGNPEEFSDGLFYFHNPFALNPVDPNVFSNTNVTQVIPTESGVQLIGNNSPIVSRINLPKLILNNDFKKELIQEAIYRFNSQAK